jgi:hypothetical protein
MQGDVSLQRLASLGPLALLAVPAVVQKHMHQPKIGIFLQIAIIKMPQALP